MSGYKQPPREHQFQKGRSGNPKGRPRKRAQQAPSLALPRDLCDLILREASRTVKMTENGREVEIQVLEAIFRRQCHSAIKGDFRASATILGLVAEALTSTELNGRGHESPTLDSTKVTPEDAQKAYFEMIKAGRKWR